MLAHILANGAVGPLDEIVQFVLPIVLLVALWWWAKRGERGRERPSTVTVGDLILDFRADALPAGRDRYVVTVRGTSGAAPEAVSIRIAGGDERAMTSSDAGEYAVEAAAPRGGADRDVVVTIRRAGADDTIATFRLPPISA